MTLPKEQRTEIRFNDGNDESEYDEATANSLVVSNGEYLKDGGVQKRAGFTAVTTAAGGTAAERHPLSLLGTRGGYAIMRKRDALIGYGPVALGSGSTSTMRRSNWHGNVSARGSLYASAVTGNAPGFSEVDGAVLTAANGRTYTLLVGSFNSSFVRFVAIDAETGMAVHAGELESGAILPRAAAHGGSFYIYYVESVSTDLKRVKFDPSLAGNGPSTSTATVFVGTLDTSAGALDVFAGNGCVRVASIEGGNLIVRAITAGTDTITATSAGAILGAGTHRLGVCCDSAGVTHVINGRDATTYIVRRYDATMTLTDTSTPAGQTNLTHTRVGIAIATDTSVATAPVLACAWSGSAADTVDTFSYAILSNDHTTVTAATELARMTMLSKPWVEYGPGDSSSQTDTEPVYACTLGRLDDNGVSHTFVGRLDPTADLPTGVVGSYQSNYVEPMASLYATGGSAALLRPTVASKRAVAVPNATPITGTSTWGQSTFDWYIPQLKLVEALSAPAEGHLLGSPEPYVFGCSMLRLEHAVCDPLPRARVGGFGWTGGGLVRVHDGQELGEATPLFPAPKLTLADHGSGTLDAGTYAYVHVLSYEDAIGRLYRSAPSASVSITVAANHDVDVTAVASLPTMRNPDGLGSDVTLGHWRSEIYRTQKTGAGVYQLVTSRPVVVGTSYTVQDSLEDADLDANKFLYTTGGVLPNEAPPPASALVAHGDRVFGVDAADRRTLFWSKPFEEGIAPEFNNEFRLRYELLDSDIVGLASMDDKLLLFTSGNVYTVTGEGPNALGVGAFNPPELVAQGVGLLAPYGLAVIPEGVLFYGTSGFKLLGRGLGLTDLSGAALNRANNPSQPSDAPLRMEHIPALQQVWMLYGGNDRTQNLTSSTLLVFDYARNHPRWLSHELAIASSALGGIADVVDVGGQPHFLLLQATSATIYRRDIGTHVDSSAQHYSLSVRVQRWRGGYRTPDGRFSEVGLLDELRVRRVHVVASGDGYTSRLQLVASTARQPRSFDTAHTETYVWDPGDLQDGTYGHVETRLRYQRVSSVDIEVSTLKQVAAGGEDDAGPVLHALIVDWAPTGLTSRRGAGFDPA